MVFLNGCLLEGLSSAQHPRNELQRAEKYFALGEYQKAALAYQRHMEERLLERSRPKDENPYFYLLLIGDCQMQLGQIDQAIGSYQQAEKQEVTPELLADRFRLVSAWFERQGDLYKAFDYAKKYRDYDPLLFDALLDRLSRDIVKQEDRQGKMKH